MDANTKLWLKNYNKAVKKERGHFSFLSFYRECMQVIEDLIDTPSSFCLLLKIYANKIDLESLKVLILDGLETHLQQLYLTIFFEISFLLIQITMFSNSYNLNWYFIISGAQ